MGLFMFLLMFVVAPIVGIFSVFALNIEPWPVGIAIFLLGAGGVLRIIYALMFESKDPYAAFQTRDVPHAIPGTQTSALPPQRDVPVTDYVSPGSAWREPETKTPASVTDSTTKLLEKER
jgi:hypothetical protein